MPEWIRVQKGNITRKADYNFLRILGYDSKTANIIRDWRLSKMEIYYKYNPP